MAKIAYSKLGLNKMINKDPVIIKFNDQQIEVAQYLPIEKKLDLISDIINNSIDESCLSSKIYLGHALYLSKTCDYILVSRVCDYGKKDKVCTRLNGLYDTLKCIIPETMIIDYNIEYTRHIYPIIGFIKMGFHFTKNPLKIIHSYIYAQKKQKAYKLQ